jgi:hypothetical protein
MKFLVLPLFLLTSCATTIKEEPLEPKIALEDAQAFSLENMVCKGKANNGKPFTIQKNFDEGDEVISLFLKNGEISKLEIDQFDNKEEKFSEFTANLEKAGKNLTDAPLARIRWDRKDANWQLVVEEQVLDPNFVPTTERSYLLGEGILNGDQLEISGAKALQESRFICNFKNARTVKKTPEELEEAELPASSTQH